MRDIHFSVDDIFGCFRYLNNSRNEIRTIWDSTTFRILKEIHDYYGWNISLYCLYTDGEYNLDDFSDRFKKEFIECSEWMKFGFHAYSGDSNYNKYNPEDFQKEYKTTIDALERIVGKNSMTDCLRLHYFSGNKDVVRILKREGVKSLLSADDNRISYGLSEVETALLNNIGTYEDSDTGMVYIKTNYRLENLSNELTKLDLDNLELLRIELFTHEKYLTDSTIMKRIEWFE